MYNPTGCVISKYSRVGCELAYSTSHWITAVSATQVDRTETLVRYDENEHSGGQQDLPRPVRKFDQKRVQTSQSDSEQRLFDELAKLEVEVMTLAELVTSKDKDLVRQTVLVSSERLNRVRKMLQLAPTTRSTRRSISDFIQARNDQSHSAGSGDILANGIAHQESHEFAPTPTSQTQIDCLRQSGVGYFRESEVAGFSEQKAL